MQQWEYKVVIGRPTEAELNELGAEGWELVALSDDVGYTLYFKRPA